MQNSQRIINEVKLTDKTDQHEPIVWIYRWRERGQLRCKPSTALRELTDQYYFEN
jgi:hypothetical protein